MRSFAKNVAHSILKINLWETKQNTTTVLSDQTPVITSAAREEGKQHEVLTAGEIVAGAIVVQNHTAQQV